jgi:RNA polymerase sigma-70 factor (ECF subfamily)
MGSPGREEPLDDDLLRRCQQGDRAALAELVRRYQDRLFRVAYRVLRDAARAEDAVADALAAVWVKCGSWRGESSAGTWVYSVAYRVIIDHARTRRRWWRFFRHEAEEPQAPDPTAKVDERDRVRHLAQRLDAALATLSHEDRALVHLHYYEGQSLADIAAITGATRDALKMRLSRARAKLRDVLGDGDEFF